MEKRTLYAALVVVLLGVASFAVLRSPEKGQRTGTKARPIPVIKPDDITKLEITTSKDEKTTIERNGDGWHIVAPFSSGADAQAMKSLTEAIGKLTFGDVVTETTTKQSELGVPDTGSVRLVITTPTTSASLILGNPVGGFTMVRVAGKNEVWQASNLFPYQINKPPKDWRDHSIFTFSPGLVDKLTVESPEGKLTLDKTTVDKKVEWKVLESSGDAPKAGDVLDQSQPVTVANALASLRANDFADDKDPKSAGLEPPALTVTLVESGKTFALQIGALDGDDYLVRKVGTPTIYRVKKYLLEHVVYRPVDYRDKTLVPWKSTEVTKVHIVNGKDVTTLVKVGDAWTLSAATPLDQAKAKTLVTGTELAGSSFLTDTTVKSGLDKPRATITIETTVGKATIKVGALTKDSGDYYVQKDGSKDVVLVKRFAIDRLLKKPADLAPSPPGAPHPGAAPHPGGMPPGMGRN
ncbi:MAG: DUF4340 domain-containing protein [Polyangia bacterium]